MLLTFGVQVNGQRAKFYIHSLLSRQTLTDLEIKEWALEPPGGLGLRVWASGFAVSYHASSDD